jgi:RNA polymerase sigma-70 factor (ECF subfamily)
VLHDMFAVPFDEIASIIGRSPAAARQLASRARRRVQGANGVPASDLSEQPEVVSAFLTALRAGDFEGLIAVLDPGVVVRADSTTVPPGPPTEIRGARTWAKGAITFSQLVRSTPPMLVDGAVGLVFYWDAHQRISSLDDHVGRYTLLSSP